LRRVADLDQTHAAVGGHRQFLVVAEPRDVDAGAVGGRDEHFADLGRDAAAVNFDGRHQRVAPVAITVTITVTITVV